jgi:type VI protein secretion system component VasK
MLAEIGFWEGFFLLLIWIPLIFLWAFALVDLFQREDLSGWAVAAWLILIILLPLLGVFFYFLFRPVTKQDAEAREAFLREREFEKSAQVADKLHKLSDLLDKGRITQEEFERQKSKLMGDQ